MKMKRNKFMIIIITFSFMLLSACSVAGSSEILQEETLTQNEPQAMEKQTVPARLTGSFTVTVREVIPDYCLDDVTPAVAVVTCFQDKPFTVYLGEEMAAHLTVGEQYVFEIADTDIGELPKEIFQSVMPSPEIVIPTYSLRIFGIRKAEEEEWGLDSIHLQYVEAASSCY